MGALFYWVKLIIFFLYCERNWVLPKQRSYFISPVAPIGGGGRRGEWRREERGVVKSQLEVVWQKPDPKGRKGAESRCIQNAKQVRTKCALFRRHS